MPLVMFSDALPFGTSGMDFRTATLLASAFFILNVRLFLFNTANQPPAPSSFWSSELEIEIWNNPQKSVSKPDALFTEDL